MSNSKVIVVTPRNISPKGTIPRIHIPLGALMIASQLENDGYNVELFDTSIGAVSEESVDKYFNTYADEIIYDGVEYWRTGQNDNDIVNRIKRFSPDIICFSCTTVVDREDTKYLIKLTRKYFPHVPIVLGGHEVTHNYAQILDNNSIERDRIDGITCISLGIGQPYISNICNYIIKGCNGELPENSAWNKNGKVVVNWDKENKIYNINNYALPNYGLLEKVYVKNRIKPYDIYSFIGNTHAGDIKYLNNNVHKIISYFPIFTSYGCGNNCTFCDTDQYLIRYSLDNVIKMIKCFDDIYGIDYIDFMDNNFAGGNKNSRDICFGILEYISRMNCHIGFSNGLTFESMMRDDFELLRIFAKYDNVYHISFPCENGNDRVLKMIRKPHNINMINKTLKMAKALLPKTNKEGFFIGGFPETLGKDAETPNEVENTVSYIEFLISEGLLNQAIFLKLSPVTSIYREMWNDRYPEKSFVHCLFSKGTAIWPYNNDFLEKARLKTHKINASFDNTVTRRL